MTSECKLCRGTLVTRAANVEEFVLVDNDPGRPCHECLIVPATEEILAVAGGWGLNPWYVNGRGYVDGRWWRGVPRAFGEGRVVPLYLPAGRDLAKRVLAWRVGLDATEGLLWQVAAWSGWELASQAHEHVFVVRASPDAGSTVHEVPALATVLRDAPLHLRACLALATCLEMPDAK